MLVVSSVTGGGVYTSPGGGTMMAEAGGKKGGPELLPIGTGKLDAWLDEDAPSMI